MSAVLVWTNPRETSWLKFLNRPLFGQWPTDYISQVPVYNNMLFKIFSQSTYVRKWVCLIEKYWDISHWLSSGLSSENFELILSWAFSRALEQGLLYPNIQISKWQYPCFRPQYPIFKFQNVIILCISSNSKSDLHCKQGYSNFRQFDILIS